jgi:hypothetical protein
MGTTAGGATPAQIATGVVQAAAGLQHSLFLKADGTLWTVGRGDSGQLGDGTVYNSGNLARSTPAQVATNVVQISGGIRDSWFAKADGTLWAMGDNFAGQLGDGTTTNRFSPVQVSSGLGTGQTLVSVLQAQVITFAQPPNIPFTYAGVTLSASADSGLPISFTVVSGAAGVSGSTLTLLGTGTITVRASQPGNSSYAAATPVTRSFTVSGDYAYWQYLYFSGAELAAGTVTGDSYVYGRDGLTNLVKYALGLDPKINATTGLPTVSAAGGNWIYTYTRPTSAPDITYAVEASTDLVTWSTTNVTLGLASTDGVTDTWQATYPQALGANVFFRLKVTR